MVWTLYKMVYLLSSDVVLEAIVHQILSKSNNIFTEIWWFNDFQNGGRPPSWILKMCSCCHVAFVVMPFCFFTHNFAAIGKSVDELCPQKRFWRWRSPPSWVSKISIFSHVTAIGFTICCSVPNFIEIRRFFTEIWQFNIFFKWRPPAILDFKNLQFLSRSRRRHAMLLAHTKFHWNWTIGW